MSLGYTLSVEAQDCIPLKNMVLIYYGGIHRDNIKWNTEKLTKYVSYTNKFGKKNYLFDSFLFLEFKDGRGYQYAPGYDHLNAGKKEWENLIKKYLGNGEILDSLNIAIAKSRNEIKTKFSKRNIIIGIPTPINNQKNWGRIQDKELDFTSPKDRISAIKWYIDTIQELFKQKKYKNITLNGFYWIDEDYQSSSSILPNAAKYIHSQNLKFYWIPYWSALGAAQWQKLGFDMAWQQPNYYFQLQTSPKRLKETSLFAKRNQMGIEVEFDDRVMSKNNPEYRNRLINYLKIFKKEKLSPKYKSVAYYQGNDDFYKIISSKDKDDKKLTKLLLDFLTSN
jgi:hypothetical protein